MTSSIPYFNYDGVGGFQFDPCHWESACAAVSTQEDIMQPPYAIQKFSNHPDDPYVARGIIPTPNPPGNQQAHCASILRNLEQDGIPDGNSGQLNESVINFIDSGYGGSCLSYRASDPSGKTGNARTFKCRYCGRQAKNNSELRKHENRHQKPYKCNARTCTKGFATKNDLNRHKRTVHREDASHEENTTLYECIHCKDQRGHSNRRKKTVWPRKDNFRAHLDRVHGIGYDSSHRLDQYIIRVQHNQTDSSYAMASVCDQAQHLALQGIGTGAHADLKASQPAASFANELVADGQNNDDDAFQEQRSSTFMHHEAHRLANASMNEQTFSQNTTVSPDMLNGQENNADAIGTGFCVANDDGSQQLQAHPSHSMTPVSCGHYINDDACSDNHGHVANQILGNVSDSNENEEYLSGHPQDTSLTGSLTGNTTIVASQTRSEPTESALYALAAQYPLTLTPSGMAQSTSQPPTHRPLMALLSHVPLEVLQAMVRRRLLESGSGYATQTYPAFKSWHICPACHKAFKRQCELTKHKKRHSRPYSCTWRNCSKSFGSKNDWKRHESKQHYNIESWVCNIAGCGKESNRRENFKIHLETVHSLPSSEFDRRADQCRKGKHLDAEFWCGFCVKLIGVDHKDGISNAWSQRIDHIDAHVCGRGTLTQQRIEEWKHKEDVAVGSRGFLDGAQHLSAASTSQTSSHTSVSRKRLVDPMDSESARPKKKRRMLLEMWQCCECDFLNLKTSPACVSCGLCQCGACSTTREEIATETVADGTHQNLDSQHLFHVL